MRYATKWIGREDEDPGGQHYTVDGVWIPDRHERRSNTPDLFLRGDEEEDDEVVCQQDDDGDVEMTDAGVGMGVDPLIFL